LTFHHPIQLLFPKLELILHTHFQPLSKRWCFMLQMFRKNNVNPPLMSSPCMCLIFCFFYLLAGSFFIPYPIANFHTPRQHPQAINSHIHIVIMITNIMYQLSWKTSNLPINLLFTCSWIPTNTQGNATMRQDEHGFWVVNLAHRLPPMAKPYVFPTYVIQVKAWVTPYVLIMNQNMTYDIIRLLKMG
jgi:hypothetical protein